MSSIYTANFARFYDLIYANIRSDIDTGYYLKKIKETNGPVLEVGVGTGRFFTEALKQGANIYGIDISPAMVDILKSKIDPKYHDRVSIQDLASFSFERKFKLIIAPFRVFMHIIETAEQIAMLNHVCDNLENDGLFIFDLFIPDPGLLSKGMNEVKDFEGEYTPGETLRRITSSHSDLVNQITDVTFRFEWTEKGQNFSESWNSQLRFCFRFELEYLLERSNFSHFQIFGDYLENPLSKSSKDFVVVCAR
jgi:SAM-dependent methyltransferase